MSRVGLMKLRAPSDKEQNKQRAMDLEKLVPVRPASAYAIFLSDPVHQARLEGEVLATGQVPSTATGRAMLSERSSLAWKLLEDAERERFVSSAVVKYQKYEDELLAWQKTPDSLELQRCRAQIKLDFSGPATTFAVAPPSTKAVEAAKGAHAQHKDEPSAELAQPSPGATEAADAPAKDDAKKRPRPASKTRAKKKVEEAGKGAQAQDKDEVSKEAQAHDKDEAPSDLVESRTGHSVAPTAPAEQAAQKRPRAGSKAGAKKKVGEEAKSAQAQNKDETPSDAQPEKVEEAAKEAEVQDKEQSPADLAEGSSGHSTANTAPAEQAAKNKRPRAASKAKAARKVEEAPMEEQTQGTDEPSSKLAGNGSCSTATPAPQELTSELGSKKRRRVAAKVKVGEEVQEQTNVAEAGSSSTPASASQEDAKRRPRAKSSVKRAKSVDVALGIEDAELATVEGMQDASQTPETAKSEEVAQQKTQRPRRVPKAKATRKSEKESAETSGEATVEGGPAPSPDLIVQASNAEQAVGSETPASTAVTAGVATPNSPLVNSKRDSADQTSDCNTPDGSKKRARKKAAKEEGSQSTPEAESGKKRARAASKTKLTAAPTSEASEVSSKAAITSKKPGKIVALMTINIPEEVAEKARLCNLDSALRNLAARPQIVEHGALSATDLLAALEKTDGLVNAAKDALLSVVAPESSIDLD